MKEGVSAVLATVLLVAFLIVMFTFGFRFMDINNGLQDNSKKATEIYLGDGGTP